MAAIDSDIEGYLQYVCGSFGWTREEASVFTASFRKELRDPGNRPTAVHKVVWGRKPPMATCETAFTGDGRISIGIECILLSTCNFLWHRDLHEFASRFAANLCEPVVTFWKEVIRPASIYKTYGCLRVTGASGSLLYNSHIRALSRTRGVEVVEAMYLIKKRSAGW